MKEQPQEANGSISIEETDCGSDSRCFIRQPIAVAICHYLPEKHYFRSEHCIPLQLGFAETGWNLGIQRDNEGDNRSDKHPLYSEYSGLYWLWKNVDAEYKGMFQHRRAFTMENMPAKKRMKQFIKNSALATANVFSHHPYKFNEVMTCTSDVLYQEKLEAFFDSLPKLLECGYDIIVPLPYRFRRVTVGEFFDEVVNRTMLASIRTCLQNLYPDYVPFFEKTWNGFKLYYGNLHIMKSKLCDDYYGFVFGVFDALESNFASNDYFIDPVNERFLYRAFGYVGELLMNTFVLKAKSEGAWVKEMTVLFNASSKGNETTDYEQIRQGKVSPEQGYPFVR